MTISEYEYKRQIELKAICGGNNQLFKKAIEYCRASTWSIDQMIVFVSTTGKLPTSKMTKQPGKTLVLLKAGVLKID